MIEQTNEVSLMRLVVEGVELHFRAIGLSGEDQKIIRERAKEFLNYESKYLRKQYQGKVPKRKLQGCGGAGG